MPKKWLLLWLACAMAAWQEHSAPGESRWSGVRLPRPRCRYILGWMLWLCSLMASSQGVMHVCLAAGVIDLHQKQQTLIGSVLQGMLIRLKAGNVAAAFNTWKELAATRQARQAKLRTAVLKLTQGRLAAAWASWRSQAEFAARAKSVVRAALTRLKQQVWWCMTQSRIAGSTAHLRPAQVWIPPRTLCWLLWQQKGQAAFAAEGAGCHSCQAIHWI